MFEMDKLVSLICGKLPDGITFKPSDVNLTDYFITTEKEEAEEQDTVTMNEWEESAKSIPITPKYPRDSNVIAIDSTSFTLGHIPDGIIGAVRLSVIEKPLGRPTPRLERYGPYLVDITNQNKDAKYRALVKAVYGQETDVSAPDCFKTLDRVRNLLERQIQLDVARKFQRSLILLDGSLIGATIANPLFVMRNMIDHASISNNTLIAISKSTNLTLLNSRRNILSLLEGVDGPCYIGSIKEHISQNKGRYLGDIYVAKLTPRGEAFRIDIPRNAPISHTDAIAQVAGLAGDYGYPEELKLAHMTSVLSSLEIIELQSAAMGLYDLDLREEIRQKIFPL